MQNDFDASRGCRGASRLASSERKTPKFRGNARGTANLLQILNPGQNPFARVARRFKKADLMNPHKLDRMMRGAVDELLAQEFSELSLTQRRRLAAWMNHDPLIRDRMIKVFEEILS